MMSKESRVEPDPFIAIPIPVFDRLAGYHDLLALYVAIKKHYNFDSGTAWPSHKRLSLMIGVSQRTVIRYTQKLVELGVLEVEPRFDERGQQTSNVYRLPWVGVTAVTGGGDTVDTPRVTGVTPLGVTDVSHKQEPIELDKENKLSMFDEFWRVYPRKHNKVTAKKAWDKAIKKEKPEVIYDKARDFADDPNLPEPRYVCLAATWLNQERWNNPPLPELRSRRRVSGVEAEALERGQAELNKIMERIKSEKE